MKNNEYFNKIADGYTLFGYQLNPKLIYFPSPNVRLEAGVFAWKDFGNAAYSQITPTFTLKYEKNNFAFLFGTLEGSLTHRLIEPLYDFERVIYDRLEHGVQFIYSHRYFAIDTWINWEKMVYRGSPFQEVLTAGASGRLKVVDNQYWKINFPLQILTSHQGGQITTANLPALTLVNGTAGLHISKQLSTNGFFRNARMEHYYVFSKDLVPSPRPFQQGKGTYLNLALSTAWLEIMGSYWLGNAYVPSRGGPLYSSVSSSHSNEGHTEKLRELFILRLMHNTRLSEKLLLSARAEPFYDFNSQEIEFSFGLYLNYKPMFLLKKEIVAHD